MKPGVPPIDLSDANVAYLRGLKPGEEVEECGDCCMKGLRGVVYLNDSGSLCVLWTLGRNWGRDAGKTMGTSVTHGTRRVSDLG